MSLSVEYNQKEINVKVLENVLKMLKNRKVIKDITELLESLSEDINNKAYIEFEISKDIQGENKSDIEKYSIYLINTKLLSISLGSPLDEYLINNHSLHKIVIIKDFNRNLKVFNQINQYKNSELFLETEMMEDITMKTIIPKHELLTVEEKDIILKQYNLNELSIIKVNDMMSRYYYAKVNDIFRIERFCKTSGISIVYRRVAN
jgi:DNA-directed RNA polymerase subunit H (RpoH/RPB5)